MTRIERQRFGRVLAAVTVLVAVPAEGQVADQAVAQDGGDAVRVLWARSQQDWLPRLGRALDTAPGTATENWSDAAAGLSGRITVFPVSVGGGFCRRFRVEVVAAAGGLDGSGVRCRAQNGEWLATTEPDRVAPVADRSADRPVERATDPGIRPLQRDLARLAYYDGPADGTMSPELRAAMDAFAADEEMPANSAASALRDRAAAAVARIPPPAGCPAIGGMEAGRVAVCGRTR
ncbi:MAG: hypothetical protein INR65_14585 [Gluconacetobacter diazotrophicus]|nr:hypothetical protein [Gluconacetobacter diazotrophicus]